jgi:hypothetical protein
MRLDFQHHQVLERLQMWLDEEGNDISRLLLVTMEALLGVNHFLGKDHELEGK